MDLYEVMRTTFAAREFTDEPVSDVQLYRLLDNARFAPSGGNRQGWRVIVLRDPETRAALLPMIEPTMRRYVAQVMAGEAPWNTINPSSVTPDQLASAPLPEGVVSAIVDAPVVLMVLLDLAVAASFDSELERVGVISGASIYPFVWNILLAARNEGLGGTLTTFVAAREDEAKALLGIPDQYAVAALLPIGRPVKQLTKLKRNEVAHFATQERFDGPTLEMD